MLIERTWIVTQMRNRVERIFILGAGGFGREIRSWLRNSSLSDQADRFVGFLDDDRGALSRIASDDTVVGAIRDFRPETGDGLIMAIGDPAVRHRIVSNLLIYKPNWLSVIHNTATIGDRCKIHDGSLICPGVVVGCDVTIREHTHINLLSTIGHDATLGSFCTLSCHVDITGDCHVSSGVFLGSHSCVTPKCRIGEQAVVGAGAVVIRDVPAHTTVFGNPAKLLFERQIN